jgi:hypothetical protein
VVAAWACGCASCVTRSHIWRQLVCCCCCSPAVRAPQASGGGGTPSHSLSWTGERVAGCAAHCCVLIMWTWLPCVGEERCVGSHLHRRYNLQETPVAILLDTPLKTNSAAHTPTRVVTAVVAVRVPQLLPAKRFTPVQHADTPPCNKTLTVRDTRNTPRRACAEADTHTHTQTTVRVRHSTATADKQNQHEERRASWAAPHVRVSLLATVTTTTLHRDADKRRRLPLVS